MYQKEVMWMPKGIYDRTTDHMTGKWPRKAYEKRFWAHVSKQPGEGCWLWNPLKPGVYGYISIGGQQVRAHRAAWFLHFGEIPEGLFVLHKCDTPGCVRPDHLFLGSARDNANDKAFKRRGPRMRSTACPHGHARDPGQQCKTCAKIASKNSYAKRMADRAAFEALPDRVKVRLGRYD